MVELPVREKKSIEEKEKLNELILLGQYHQLKSLLTKNPQFQIEPWLLQACYEGLGDLEQLEQSLQEIASKLRQIEDWTNWCYWKSKLLVERGSILAAERALTIGMTFSHEISKPNPALIANLQLQQAIISIKKGSYDQAVTQLTELASQLTTLNASNIHSQYFHIQCLRWRGESYILLGNPKKALTDLHEGLKQADHFHFDALKYSIQTLLGKIYYDQGQLDKALSTQQEALVWYMKLGNSAAIATNLCHIANISRTQGHLKDALTQYEQSLALQEQINNPSAIALTLAGVGIILREQGRFDDATKFFQRSLKLREKIGNPSEIAASLYNLVFIARHQGRFNEALDLSERALKLREQVGNPQDIASSLVQISTTYQYQGRWNEALEYNKRALVINERLENPANIATTLLGNGIILWNLGRLKEALDFSERSLALREQVGNPLDIGASLGHIGLIYCDLGQLTKALDYYERSLKLKEQVGNPIYIAVTLNNIAFIYKQQGRLNKALELFNRNLQLYEKLNAPSRIAETLQNIGAIFLLQDRLQEAFDYFSRSFALDLKGGNALEIASCCVYMCEVEAKQGLLHANNEFLTKFPPPPYESPLILIYRTIIDALLAQQTNDWVLAEQKWSTAIKYPEADYSIQLQCHEALTNIAFLEIQKRGTKKSVQKLKDQLQQWENLCQLHQNRLPANLCQIYLLRAKFAQAFFEFSQAEDYINKCLHIATEIGLPLHEKLAKIEMNAIKTINSSVTPIQNKEEYQLAQLTQFTAYLQSMHSQLSQYDHRT